MNDFFVIFQIALEMHDIWGYRRFKLHVRQHNGQVFANESCTTFNTTVKCQKTVRILSRNKSHTKLMEKGLKRICLRKCEFNSIILFCILSSLDIGLHQLPQAFPVSGSSLSHQACVSYYVILPPQLRPFSWSFPIIRPAFPYICIPEFVLY